MIFTVRLVLDEISGNVSWNRETADLMFKSYCKYELDLSN